ncbi:MAG TPA: GAF and ANTAR domain-containing protein [Blastococcus sp.]
MPNDPTSPSDSAQLALEQLGRLTLREHSMETVLQRVVDLTKTVMPGRPEVSISLIAKDKPTTPVSTGQLAVDCDESQYGRGYGPCLHAATTGDLVEIADMRAEPRWRDYVRQAADRGALSSLSVPLRLDEGMSAALNIYARTSHAFDQQSRSTAGRFVPYAAVAVANMHAYQDARDLADNLQLAMESRAVIDQAKGIVMERHKLTAVQAFQLLAEASMRTNRKLRDVAEYLVTTGELISPTDRQRRRGPG